MKINRLHFFFYFNIQAQYEVKKKSITGQYDVLIKQGNTVCKYLQVDKKFWPRIVEKSNMPAGAPCPFPKVKKTNVTPEKKNIIFILFVSGSLFNKSVCS